VPFISGKAAVEVFYVISGWYIQLVLAEKYTATRLGDSFRKRFYQARYSRLLPSYLLIASLTLLAAALSSAHPLASAWNDIGGLPDTPANRLLKGYLIMTNCCILFQDVAMFTAVRDGGATFAADFQVSQLPVWSALAIPPAWSLGVELAFYAIAPCVLAWRTGFVVSVAVLSVIAKVCAVNYFSLGDPWTYRFFPFELGYFLFGSVLYRLRRWFIPSDPAPQAIMVMAAIFLAAFLSLSGYVGKAVDRFLLWEGSWSALLPVVAGVSVPFLFVTTSSSRLDRLLGELSYPIYLSHWLIITLVAPVTGLAVGSSWRLTILVIGITVGLSVALRIAETALVEPRRRALATN
jgi:peptidoglycan/LPS O-acetylase OafA/YrhL